MKLYMTPLSHFSRKIRVIAGVFGLQMEYVDVGPVAAIGLEKFANNPLMGVPVLTAENLWLVDSENIAAYLLKKYDPHNTLKYFSNNLADLNARAIMNGTMANDVKIVQGTRSHIPVYEYPYFQKAKESILCSLEWLNSKADSLFSDEITYNTVLLTCTIDHLKYFDVVDLNSFSKLTKLTEKMNTHSVIGSSNPFILKPK